MIAMLLPFLESFESICCGDNIVRYEERAITNIEGFYWWSLVGLYKPDIIIESGVALARSTEILARAQKYFDIPYHYAFDIEDKYRKKRKRKLSPYKTIFQLGNSADRALELIPEYRNSKALFIIDGPKHGKEYIRLIEVSSQFDVCAIASHDCYPFGKTSKTRNDFQKATDLYHPEMSLYYSEPSEHSKIMHVNDCIREEMLAKNPEFLEDDKFHYIGIRYAPLEE